MVKAKYNPSTGKASYNAVTGKQQIAVETPAIPCQYCSGDTPKRLRVTFSGVTIGNGCGSCPGDLDKRYSNVPDINRSFILDQKFSCTWEFEDINSSFITERFYSSTNGSCSGLVGTFESKAILVKLTKISATKAELYCQAGTDQPFAINFSTPSADHYEPTSKCVEVVDAPNSQTTPWCRSGWGGTVTVEEL